MSEVRWTECEADREAESDALECRRKAIFLRRHADELEVEGHHSHVKRYAEAAYHLETAAACLDGSRTFATEAELAETRAKYGEEVARG